MENGNEFLMISLLVPLSMCFKKFILFFVARNEARVLCSLLSNGVSIKSFKQLAVVQIKYW